MAMTPPVLAHNVEHYCHAHDEAYSFTEWTPGSISRWIGKCKQCKAAKRAEVRQDIRLRWQYSSPDKMYFSKREYQYACLTPDTKHHVDKMGHYVTIPCPSGCQYYGQPMQIVLKRIDGHYNEGIKCGAKCINATGPNCECQCGGENHGANH